MIEVKLKQKEYGQDLQKLYEDMTTMFENCKSYNKPESGLYIDAERYGDWGCEILRLHRLVIPQKQGYFCKVATGHGR